jgi:hypothetical protein
MYKTLKEIIETEDYDLLYDLMLSSRTDSTGMYLSMLYHTIAADHHLHEDDDHGKIFLRMVRFLQDKYEKEATA